MIILDEVKRLARAREKIHAIKVLRAATGIGLTAANEIVKTLAAGGEAQLAPGGNENKDHCIRRQLEALCRDGRASVLDSTEIGTLLEIVRDDEDLVDLVLATSGNHEGVLVATQRRLLFVNKPLVGRLTVEEFPLDHVYLVYHRAGVVRDSVAVFMGGSNKAEFTNVEKGVSRSFVTRVQARATGRDRFEPVDESEELELLEAFWEHGALSAQEFADGKRRIADQLRRRTRRDAGFVRRPS